MARKTLASEQEVLNAIEIYQTTHKGILSSYDESTKVHNLEDTENNIKIVLGPYDTWTGTKLEEALQEIIVEQRETPTQEPIRSPNLALRKVGGIKSRSEAGSVPGSALEAVRACQNSEKATYSIGKEGKGRKAAAAKTNIAALMEAGGSLEIIKREHRTDFIEVVVRAKIPNVISSMTKTVDSSISIFKQEYLAKKAWDWIVKVLMEEPGIVIGTDDYGMPEFKEGATIKVRLSDEGKSILVPLPAKIALWREMAREWQFAGRVCETKAYSRAADMLLRGDFQSAEELKEEQSEVSAIRENEKAGVA